MRSARLGLLGAFAVALLAATVPWWSNGDWLPLAVGGRQLLHANALHAYVDQSSLQAGPPALLVIGLLALTGPLAPTLVHICLWLIGIAIAWLAVSTARINRAGSGVAVDSDPVTVQRASVVVVAVLPMAAYLLSQNLTPPVLGVALVVGVLSWLWLGQRSAAARRRTVTMSRTTWVALLVVGPWAPLASVWLHLEDGLAMLAMAVALHERARGRRWAVAVAVGAAIAFKPWAVAALPLLWRPGDRKGVIRDAAAALAIPAVSWLPFVVAVRGTLGAAGRPFPIGHMSPLYVLGLHDATAPPWLRSAQLVMIVVCACWGLRRSPADALAAGMVARLLFDPAAFDYYTAGVIAFVAMADIVNRRPSWRTALAVIGLWLSPYYAGTVHAQGLLRTLTLGILLTSSVARAPVAVVVSLPRRALAAAEPQP